MTNLGVQTSDLQKKLEKVEKVVFHGWGSVGTTPTAEIGLRVEFLLKTESSGYLRGAEVT